MVYQVVSTLLKTPGKCASCASPGRDGRTFLDTGLRFARFGTLYLCSECMVAFAKLFGMVHAEQLEIELAELAIKYEKLETDNEYLRNAVDSLNRVSVPASADSVAPSQSDSEDNEQSEPDDKQPVKPAAKRGSKDVQNSSGTNKSPKSNDDGEFSFNL